MKHLASRSLIRWSFLVFIASFGALCLFSHHCTALTIPVTHPSPFVQAAYRQDTIRIWHDQDGAITHWLQKIWESSPASGLKADSALEVDHKPDFKAELCTRPDGIRADPPDVMILPNDLIGLHGELGLSEIPSKTVRGIKRRFLNTVRGNGRIYGIPLLVSDVLVLFYNKRIVSRPVDDMDRLGAMRSEDSRFVPISWPFSAPRYFAPFLVATGAWPGNHRSIRFDRPAFNEAFTEYEDLVRDEVIDPGCDSSCAFKTFLQGGSAYAIGPVSSLRLAREVLRQDLGVAPLPSIHRKPLRPLYRILALVFPFHSLRGARRSRLLAFARALSSRKAQLMLGEETGLVPVNGSAFESLARRADPGMRVALRQIRHALPIPSRREMPSFWLALDKTLKTITKPDLGGPSLEPGREAQQLFLSYQSQLAEQLQERR